MTPTLRAGDDDDVDECVRLWLDALLARDGVLPRAGSDARARAKLTTTRVAFRVADSAGRLDGFVVVGSPGSGFPRDPPAAGYLSLLAVRPAAQGRGLARALLAAAEHDAAAVVDEVVLHVLAGNASARALYASSGWTEAGSEAPHPLSGAPMLTLRRSLVR